MQLEQVFELCVFAIVQATLPDVAWRLTEETAGGHLYVGHIETDAGRVTVVDSISRGPRSCEVWGIDPYAEDAKVEVSWKAVADRATIWEDQYASRSDVIDLRDDGYHESLFLTKPTELAAQLLFSAQDLEREIESNVPRFAEGGALLFAVTDAKGMTVQTTTSP
ncbi:hypothetical protein [Yoonia sp. 2307UL14-13]|uniref:hypothetical protein n=1 Tax=Yoonia sp. 2307UL14-13 TaxID=3126506 RepID=UPI003095ACB2